MNIFFLSPSPVVIEVCEKACACAKAAKEAGTNCFDVAIVIAICVTIAIIAILGICKYFSWKKQQPLEELFLMQKKHLWDVEDAKRKKTFDLIEKLNDALKCQTEIKDDKGKVIAYKEYKSDEIKAYGKALINLINDIGNYNLSFEDIFSKLQDPKKNNNPS